MTGSFGPTALRAGLAVLLAFYVVHAGLLPPGLAGVARDLVVILAILASAASLGDRVLGALRIDLGGRGEDRAYYAALAVGLGFIAQYATVVGLGIAQALNPLTVLLTVAAPLPLGVPRARAAWAHLRARRTRPARRRWTLPSVLAASFFVAYCVLASSPPSQIDELTYHLALPQEWLAHGGFGSDGGNFMQVFPPAASALYALALGLGSEMATKPLHLACFGIMVVATHWHARRLLGAGAARLAVLLFVADWSVQDAAARANNDFHWGYCGLVAALVVADGLAREGSPFRRSWPALGGLFLGGALAGKLQSVDVLVGLDLLLAWMIVRGATRVGPVLLLNVIAGLVYVPTFARNVAYGADPLFLALAPRIGNPTGIDPLALARFGATGEIRRIFMTEPNAATLLFSPVLMFFEGRPWSVNYDGYTSPFVLIVPLLLPFAARTNPTLRALGIYLAGFYVTWVLTAPQPRYAFPALPLLALGAVASLDWASRSVSPGHRVSARRGLRALTVLFAALSFVGLLRYASWPLGNNLSVWAGLQDKANLLRRSGADPTLKVAQALDAREATAEAAPAESRKVFMVFASQGYYLGRPSYNDPFYVNLVLMEHLASTGVNPLDWLAANGYAYVLTDFARVPWMRDAENSNTWLNPYPDALARLDDLLAFWQRVMAPQLVKIAEAGTLEVWVRAEPSVAPPPEAGGGG